MDIFLFEITQRFYHSAFISKINEKAYITRSYIFKISCISRINGTENRFLNHAECIDHYLKS